MAVDIHAWAKNIQNTNLTTKLMMSHHLHCDDRPLRTRYSAASTPFRSVFNWCYLISWILAFARRVLATNATEKRTLGWKSVTMMIERRSIKERLVKIGAGRLQN